jgi:hypothetical protein
MPSTSGDQPEICRRTLLAALLKGPAQHFEKRFLRQVLGLGCIATQGAQIAPDARLMRTNQAFNVALLHKTRLVQEMSATNTAVSAQNRNLLQADGKVGTADFSIGKQRPECRAKPATPPARAAARTEQRVEVQHFNTLPDNQCLAQMAGSRQ